MTRPTITIIVPTFGRSTLLDAIECVLPQLLDGDEFIVVGDGPVDLARDICAQFPRITYMETPVFKGDYGCTPCDYAIERATTDYLMFLGDDDKLTANALVLVRGGLLDQRSMYPHLFAMMHTGRMLCDSYAPCQVSGQQLVVPNYPNLPKMADVLPKDILTSDWYFIDRVVRQFGGVVFHPDVICVLERQNFGAAL